MNWRRGAILPILVILGSSCATEGGSRGTGISTTIQGNVESVQTAALDARPPSVMPTRWAFGSGMLRLSNIAQARSLIEDIRVTVEGTTIQDQTDANGSFLLRGGFEGNGTLVFQLPDLRGSARIAITVPAAGTLTVSNVTIDAQTGQATAESQDIDCEGTIATINCQDQTLNFVSVQHTAVDQDHYTVRLDTSSIHDAHGAALTCSDLRIGRQVRVQGAVNADGTFGDALIEVED